MNLFIYLGSALAFFFSLYLSYEYWYKKIWGKVLLVRDETRAMYDELFVDKTPERVLNEILLVSGGLGAFVFFVFWPTVPLSIIGFILAFWFSKRIPLIYLTKLVREKRIKMFTEQMLDALILMTNGLKSGLNVPQTLQIVVEEMPAPISQEYNLVLSENKVGLPLEKAFDNLAKRIPTEDVNMFVTSVNILRETGGNLAETFETIANTIRERFKLQSKISAMTAQGMTSAVIVAALPWVIGGMLYVIDPVMTKPLFTTGPGFVILAAVIALEVIGFLVILKIIKIRV
ncbi:hypothetical protein GW915_08895 [bacterium]|nr:hypothetical protein [bacterium]